MADRMDIWHGAIEKTTKGHGEIIDITSDLEALVRTWGIADGTGTVFAPGSTASITTIEYEPGVVRDLQEVLEKLAPEGRSYHHDNAWGDGNGYAHVRAALMGPSVAFSVMDSALVRGTWQQFVLCDFDNRSRRRSLAVTITGKTSGDTK